MNPTWILMFYSMPSKPERNRLRIYRRLQKEGTLSLKDGVHLLPYSEEHYEFFGWLSQEIKSLNGEMQFVVVEKIELIKNEKIIHLFTAQAESSYHDLEQRIKSMTVNVDKEDESRQILKKITRDFDACNRIDFFNSAKGKRLKKAIQSKQIILESLGEPLKSNPAIPTCNRMQYQHKHWQTRPKPFVDRMASAWLIRKFIDPHAKFIFSSEIDHDNSDIVSYDMNDAIFTHIGDLCTFEVLLRSFEIHDVNTDHMAKIIHNLDINDDKYITPEADGIKMILTVIRQKTASDTEILIQSDLIFDYLYASHP
jgi:hypothetical protein